MNELETFTGPNGRPTQLFNGMVYQLQPSDPRYFEGPKKERLHIAVWTFYNGKPPKKHHVHHINEDKHNNKIENLELKKASKHISDHMQKWLKEDPEHFQRLAKSGQDAAAKWSKTEEGQAFRKSHAQTVLAPFQAIFLSKVSKVCDNCGVAYDVIKAHENSGRFCSNACKTASRYKSGVDNIDATCIVCQVSFVKNKYSKKVTCSKSCGCKLGQKPEKYRR